MTVKVGDEIEAVEGAYVGHRARVVDKIPRTAPYATHVRIKGPNLWNAFRNRWIPVKMWRKVEY